MLSKNCIKKITSLQIKKFRNQMNCFVAEGPRLVDEILCSNLNTLELYHTSNWEPKNGISAEQVMEISNDEMKKISSLNAPSSVLAVVEIPNHQFNILDISQKLTLALDSIQDPGNLGTIIRLADWFGIDSILCSHTTADAFSPKVVQASMGAITRVKVCYCNLSETLLGLREKMPIYGAFMEGENIYTANLSAEGVIVMGNEGNGICSEIEKIVSKKIHIPTFAYNRSNVESLNVAMATAAICSEFRSRNFRS